jgi:chromosome segregation protein
VQLSARDQLKGTVVGVRTGEAIANVELNVAGQRMVASITVEAVEELGIDPEVLVDEFGPHREVPHVAGPGEDPDAVPEPVAYVREEQEKRLRKAERGLQALGRVNPLALEEFAALEERHSFLTTQLEDLKRSKRDLLDIVKEIDERVEEVFTEAFHDTREQFERVFERLFPGGEGRLVLTDPDDMLTTGIEVEAALDDTNLGRLITLFEELRDSSQLIVITHQKRTMEVADALYGVSMRGDGVTTVVSQRIRDVAATA